MFVVVCSSLFVAWCVLFSVRSCWSILVVVCCCSSLFVVWGLLSMVGVIVCVVVFGVCCLFVVVVCCLFFVGLICCCGLLVLLSIEEVFVGCWCLVLLMTFFWLFVVCGRCC